jgi:hypothetical protein
VSTPPSKAKSQQADEIGAANESREIVRDPVTGKLVHRYLLEASEKHAREITRPGRPRRRVF